MAGEQLTREFFQGSPVACAQGLIGVRLCWGSCEGVIVETEAYEAEGDEACHTSFRPSARAFVEEHPAGTAYVYLNYGVHWLFNLLVKGVGEGFVLFRALEPVAGIDQMRLRRGREKSCDLCSGPGKLTQAFGIDKSSHGRDVIKDPEFKLLRNERSLEPPLACRRIGISRAVERPWRFVRASSPHLSVPAEKSHK